MTTRFEEFLAQVGEILAEDYNLPVVKVTEAINALRDLAPRYAFGIELDGARVVTHHGYDGDLRIGYDASHNAVSAEFPEASKVHLT